MKKGFLEDNQYTGKLLEHFNNFWNDYSNWICVWNGRFYNSCKELDEPTIKAKSRFYDTDEFIILDLKFNHYTEDHEFLFNDKFYSTLIERVNKGSVIIHVSNMPAVFTENDFSFKYTTPIIFEYKALYKLLNNIFNDTNRKAWIDVEVKGSVDILNNEIERHTTVEEITNDNEYMYMIKFLEKHIEQGNVDNKKSLPCSANIRICVYDNYYNVTETKLHKL